ncbi:MAG: four helix bundle protein [Pirellulales bacterium]|nr:four helix bundle protein [Pirellulales bacterium]
MRIHREEQINAPVVLVKWYDWTKWLLERVDSFPKNQRFIFGTRLADRSIRVLEILVEASYRAKKAEFLAEANRQIEVLHGRTHSRAAIAVCLIPMTPRDKNVPSSLPLIKAIFG